MSLFWIGRFERKVRYFNRAKNEALRHQAESMDSIYIFSEDSFEYQDNEKSFRLNWSLFKPFVIYKDSILLILSDSAAVGFTIGRSEIGDKEFLELCDILKQKTCKT